MAITLKIEGLELISEVGLPKPLHEGDEVESVYFYADLGDGVRAFRLGEYDFKENYFHSDNGYGGEVWPPECVVAWKYWCDPQAESDTLKISEI